MGHSLGKCAAQPEATERHVRNLDNLAAHGINLVGVYVQGSNGGWPDPEAGLDGYEPDGRLKPVATRLEWLIREADARGMVVMVGCFLVMPKDIRRAGAQADAAKRIALSFDESRTRMWLGRVSVEATVKGIPITLVLGPTTVPGIVEPPGTTGLRDMSIKMAIEMTATGIPLVGDVERSAFVTLATAEHREVVGSIVQGEPLTPNGWLALVGAVDFALQTGIEELHLVLLLANRVEAPLPW